MDPKHMKPTNQESGRYSYLDLMEIVHILRGEGGCPWDREQTHETLKTPLLEECYEVIEAINNKDSDNLCEELGDVLLSVALHTVIAEEEQEFEADQVTDRICRKMIHRHPHVFGDASVENSAQVLINWEERKKLEKPEQTLAESLKSVPKALPATTRASKVQKKIRDTGVIDRSYEDAMAKVHEYLDKISDTRRIGDETQLEEVFGEFMFSIVNLSRFLEQNAENSLTNATDKFINRFVDVERLALREGKHLCEMSIDELRALWGQVK